MNMRKMQCTPRHPPLMLAFNGQPMRKKPEIEEGLTDAAMHIGLEAIGLGALAMAIGVGKEFVAGKGQRVGTPGGLHLNFSPVGALNPSKAFIPGSSK